MELFDKVLVANRGEIAVRVIRTLQAMGIHAVAVYSEADINARHVSEADSSFCLGPAPAAESYLNIAKVVGAAQSTGAQAVHPGYGFLSENPDFAKALQVAGIVLIGPNIGALEAMADKIRAKELVANYGVPVAAGFSAAGLSDEQITEQAIDIGFPLLIKPSAGGGGKGMVQVREPSEVPAALGAARRIARSAFGDDTLLLERLIDTPRHIEVQILADTQGNTVHLGERECSLQRRHQKVIEEAPSALLESLPQGALLRECLGAAAIAAAKSVAYVGAGTVEFLVSSSDPDEFFFMEMNTRLQVEHPVTEQVIRIGSQPLDLVQWQVRIAAGETLDFTQEQVHLVGHSIEARLYAEIPEQDFMPSTGTVSQYVEPVLSGLRIDSMLATGISISAHYDPMLAKVIATGSSREAALAKLRAALSGLQVHGLHTNREFLDALLADPQVRHGELDTGLIARFLESWHPRSPKFIHFAQAVAHWLVALPASRGPWSGTGFSNTGVRPRQLFVEYDGQIQQLSAVRTGRGWAISQGSDQLFVELKQGRAFLADQPLAQQVPAETIWVDDGATSFALRKVSREEHLSQQLESVQRSASPLDATLRSPMPGTVCLLNVRDGQQVHAGDLLMAVEAMKMEHEISAPASGVVQLLVGLGEQLAARQPVIQMHYESAEES